MKIKDAVELVKISERTNYWILAPDNLGLNLILNKVLASIAPSEDLHFIDASTLTKERTRALERETRMAARGSSDYAIFFIYKMQNLSVESVAPLLKTVEDSKFARFIFQSQSLPRKIRTLMSRSSVIRLGFLSKAAVLANLKSLQFDAKSADQHNLWDGTLSGTISALQMREAFISMRKDLSLGARGLASLLQQEVVNSMCFLQATYPYMSPEERQYISRLDTADRRKMALILAMDRIQQ